MIFFFLCLLANVGVWFLFNGLLALCFLSFTSPVILTGYYTEDEPYSVLQSFFYDSKNIMHACHVDI